MSDNNLKKRVYSEPKDKPSLWEAMKKRMSEEDTSESGSNTPRKTKAKEQVFP